MNSNKGFTLIELLVVIAIIGILSSIVLASLNSARSRAKISAAKAEMSSMRAEAELMYATYGTYDFITGETGSGVCEPGSDAYLLWASAADSVGWTLSSARCNDSANDWAAEIELEQFGNWFCVDSSGTAIASTDQTSFLVAGDVTCEEDV